MYLHSYAFLRHNHSLHWVKLTSTRLFNMSFSTYLSASLSQMIEEEVSDSDEEKK